MPVFELGRVWPELAVEAPVTEPDVVVWLSGAVVADPVVVDTGSVVVGGSVPGAEVASVVGALVAVVVVAGSDVMLVAASALVGEEAVLSSFSGNVEDGVASVVDV